MDNHKFKFPGWLKTGVMTEEDALEIQRGNETF